VVVKEGGWCRKIWRGKREKIEIMEGEDAWRKREFKWSRVIGSRLVRWKCLFPVDDNNNADKRHEKVARSKGGRR
jgi:hypothetical protein